LLLRAFGFTRLPTITLFSSTPPVVQQAVSFGLAHISFFTATISAIIHRFNSSELLGAKGSALIAGS
jgi:hypothetical protein